MVTSRDNQLIDNTQRHGDVVAYRVRAVAKDRRCSGWSQRKQITVGDITPPPDPSGFQVTSGYAGCLLRWNFPDDPTYKHTEIFRKTINAGDQAFFDDLNVSGVTGDFFRLVETCRAEETFIRGDQNAEYQFKIRHIDNSKNASNFSQVLTGRTRALKPQDVYVPSNKTETYIYIKPPNKDGIPGDDIVFETKDAQGNIIKRAGNYFADQQDQRYSGVNSSINTINSIITGLQNSINTLNSNDNTINSRLSTIESTLVTLSSKIAMAISSVSISTPNGTQEGTYSVTSNTSGMKTLTIQIDVNCGGFVNAIKDVFIIRPGQVTTSVSGQIVGTG